MSQLFYGWVSVFAQRWRRAASGSLRTRTTTTTTSRSAARWRSRVRWRPLRPRSCSSAGWRTAGRYAAPSAWSSRRPTPTSRPQPPTSTSSTSSSPTSEPTPVSQHSEEEPSPRSASTSTSPPPLVSLTHTHTHTLYFFSYLYLYSAFNNTDCVKGALQYQIGNSVSIMQKDNNKHSIFSKRQFIIEFIIQLSSVLIVSVQSSRRYRWKLSVPN